MPSLPGQNTIPTFPLIYCEKPRKASVSIADVLAEIRSQHLLNINLQKITSKPVCSVNVLSYLARYMSYRSRRFDDITAVIMKNSVVYHMTPYILINVKNGQK
jgi:hypothetical protein